MDPFSWAAVYLVLQFVGGAAASIVVTSVITKMVSNTPAATSWFRRRFFGAEVAVVGQAQSGKTSFYNWARLNQFPDKVPPLKTTERRENKRFSKVINEDYKLDVSVSFDIVGDDAQSTQVGFLFSRSPTILLVFLDSSDPAHQDWLRGILWEIKSHLKRPEALAGNAKFAKNLFGFQIIVNKLDKVAGSATSDQIKQGISSIVNAEMAEVVDEPAKKIDVLVGSLYSTSGGEVFGNEIVIRSVARAMKKTRIFSGPKGSWLVKS
jgi:hypothetical protein